MSNTRFMGPLMVPNDEPKSVNINKISTALHVYYLNLIVNYLNTVQIAQIQAYNVECTHCSDAISGPMNRVFDNKSGHDFCRYRNSIQVIYFQINVNNGYIYRYVTRTNVPFFDPSPNLVVRSKNGIFVRVT